MKRTFFVKKDPTMEAQDDWLNKDYRQYAAWRETDEGKNREIVFAKNVLFITVISFEFLNLGESQKFGDPGYCLLYTSP